MCCTIVFRQALISRTQAATPARLTGAETPTGKHGMHLGASMAPNFSLAGIPVGDPHTIPAAPAAWDIARTAAALAGAVYAHSKSAWRASWGMVWPHGQQDSHALSSCAMTSHLGQWRLRVFTRSSGKLPRENNRRESLSEAQGTSLHRGRKKYEGEGGGAPDGEGR